MPDAGSGRGRDEFYVGYLPQAPAGLAAHVRRAMAILLISGGGAAALLAVGQPPFAPAAFEFGRPVELRGTVREGPHPILVVPRPGRGDGEGVSSYLLVERGKHGAAGAARGLDGKPVQLEGTLIYRNGETMVELVPGSVREEVAAGTAPAAGSAAEDLGVHTLVGEIVDSKCYLGVMNPGEGKVHRGCATRCISGGVPPLLVTRDREGRTAQFVLVSAEARPLNRDILDRVGEPVEVRGRVERRGDLLLLRAVPSDIRRVAG